MNVKLGDTLTFSYCRSRCFRQSFQCAYGGLGQFNAQFFMIFSPDVLVEVPTTYLTSFHYQNHAQLAELIKTFQQ